MFEFLSRKTSQKAMAAQQMQKTMIDPQIKSAVPNWYGLYDPYQVYEVDGQRMAFRNLTPIEIVRFFETISPVNGAVSRIARAVSGLPLQLTDLKTNTAVESHPFLNLLRAPNQLQQQTRRSLIRDMVIWRLIAGDTYLLLTGALSREPLEMYVMDPTEIMIYTDAMGFPEKFVHSPRKGVMQNYTRNKDGRFVSDNGLQELLHFSNFTTRPSFADAGGSSELGALYYEINQYIHACQYNVALLANGARPSGALVWKGEGNMSDDVYTRLKNQVQTEFAGAANAGRPLLLEGDLDWKELAVKARDGDFRNVKLDAEEAIYKALEIPVGLVKTDGTTANNMKNLRHEFYQSRVVPLGDDICEFLNINVLDRRFKEKGIELQIDRDEIDVFIAERAEKRKIIENSTTMTINEKRKHFGEKDIEGGNKIVDPNGRPIAGPDAKGEIGFDGAASEALPPQPLPAV